MKPIKLTLCGWGPYKDKQEIDFTDLMERGLFLITGATGGGKTTIFDAITYALYGNMSGDVREKGSVRSDFAGMQTPTYVELRMEHEGREYHIYRNPEYLRPRKRKNSKAVTASGKQAEQMAEMAQEAFTKEKERAVLTDPEGKVTEGTTEVNRKLQTLLKLDYRQFKQLSMIAQGEFARFLSASSGEKTRIFRELFGTDIYEKVAAALRAKSADLYKQIMEYRHKMDENIHMYTPAEASLAAWQELTGTDVYYYENVLGFLRKEKEKQQAVCAESREQCREKEEALQEATGKLAEAEQIQSLFEKLETEREKQKQLTAKSPEYREKEVLLKRQRSAYAIRPFEMQYTLCREQAAKIEKELQQTKEKIERLTEMVESKSWLYGEKDEIAAIYAVLAKKRELTNLVMEKSKWVKEKEKELCKLQEDYLIAEKEEDFKKQAYEQAERAYCHGMAGILAQGLLEGMPCPVCGSLHHPAPVPKEKEVPSEQQVKEIQDVYEKRQKLRMQLQGKTIACREQLKDGELSLEALSEDAAALDGKLAEKDDIIISYVNRYTEKEFQKELTWYGQQMVLLEEKQLQCKRLKEEKEEAEEKTKQLKAAFVHQCIRAGFSGADDYKAILVEEAVSSRLQEEIQIYRAGCQANAELISHLQEETGKQARPDLEGLRGELSELKMQRDALLRQQNLWDALYRETKKMLVSLQEKKTQLDQRMENYSLLKDLDDAANGNNKKRLVFEQYVLASYFEEILHAANLRLLAMTGGRYELRRAAGVLDGRSKDNLEIEVMDYYTGKYRSVKTLSGGESFKVSLSLALGMSDVVQACSGGIRVETLFIDEGFGSLDSESLEQAHGALQSLVEKDRLIGIISHVPELSEKIAGQIRVHKTNAGSTLEVVVS